MAEAGAGKTRLPIVWEHVPCPLCRAHAGELLIAAAGEPAGTVYRVVRCRFCGLGYVNPRPDFASIGQFYPDDYSPYRVRPLVLHRPSAIPTATLAAQARRYTRFAVPLNSAAFSVTEKLAESRLKAFHATA